MHGLYTMTCRRLLWFASDPNYWLSYVDMQVGVYQRFFRKFNSNFYHWIKVNYAFKARSVGAGLYQVSLGVDFLLWKVFKNCFLLAVRPLACHHIYFHLNSLHERNSQLPKVHMIKKHILRTVSLIIFFLSYIPLRVVNCVHVGKVVTTNCMCKYNSWINTICLGT